MKLNTSIIEDGAPGACVLDYTSPTISAAEKIYFKKTLKCMEYQIAADNNGNTDYLDKPSSGPSPFEVDNFNRSHAYEGIITNEYESDGVTIKSTTRQLQLPNHEDSGKQLYVNGEDWQGPSYDKHGDGVTLKSTLGFSGEMTELPDGSGAEVPLIVFKIMWEIAVVEKGVKNLKSATPTKPNYSHKAFVDDMMKGLNLGGTSAPGP